MIVFLLHIVFVENHRNIEYSHRTHKKIELRWKIVFFKNFVNFVGKIVFATCHYLVWIWKKWVGVRSLCQKKSWEKQNTYLRTEKKSRKMRHISARKKTKSGKNQLNHFGSRKTNSKQKHISVCEENLKKTYTSFRYEQKKSRKITNTHSVSGKNKHISVRKKSK